MPDLVTLVEQNAARRPSKPAVITATQSLTYSELLQRAASENAASPPPAPRRAVIGRDAVTVAVALVASAMASGAVLMVDPAAPEAEAERARARFGGGGQDGSGLPAGLGLTTSGVSGEPRCVVRPWELVADNAAAFAEALDLGPDDVVMATSSVHHSYAVSAGLCGALAAGASFAAPTGLLTPRALARCIDSCSVSVLLSVPMLYRWYTVGVPAAGAPRLCVSAGEALDDDLRKAWEATVGWPLAEHYGTSELGQLTVAAPGDGGFGRPVRGVKVRTVPLAADGARSSVPVPEPEIGGMVEVSVAGPPAVIVDASEGQIDLQPLTGWQATGDIGVVDGGGRIRVDGRVGDVVNVGGKKVALREVEAVLRALPGVRDGAVIARAGAGGVPKLHAFVVAGEDFSSSEAVAVLKENLAPHKVPRRVQCLDALPRTGSGKVRRLQLDRLVQEGEAARPGAGSAASEAVPADTAQAGPARTICVPFDGPGSGMSHPTWGAVSIRRSIDWLGEDAGYFNDRNVIAIPEGISAEKAVSAVAAVVSRHQALRTRYPSAGGEMVMRVEGSGQLQALEYEVPAGADPCEWAERLAGELARPLFTGQELPLRCAVVHAGGTPRFLLLILSHQSIDAWTVGIVRSELQQLWAGSADALSPQPWQLLDQAADEKSGHSSQRGAAALEYWRAFYAAATPLMFDAARRTPEPYPVQSVMMTSPATRAATESIARRLATSTSAVLAGLAALVLGLVTGHDRVTLLLIAANRFDAKRRELVAPMVQDVLCQVNCGADVDTAIRNAAASTLAAYSHACYDPAAELRVRHEAELRRGVRFDFHGAIFNDVRPRGQWGTGPAPGAGAPALDELRAVTRFGPGGRWRRQNTTCFVRVLPSATCQLELMADTRYFSVPDMQDILAGIESAAVTAASRPVPLEELAATCRLPKLSRGPGWVRHRNGWVDTGALTALLRGLPQCRTAAVVAGEETAPGAPRTLSAYVCAEGAPDVAGLHRALIEAMRAGGGVAVAPDRYLVCAAPPAGAQTPQAWTACDVLVTGDGRPR